MKNITVDGIEYKPVRANSNLEIIIADKTGLTFVGYLDSEVDELGFVIIEKARCVIRWGTSKHLAELADVRGPLENTVLGLEKDVKIRLENITARYVCNWTDNND